jgi:hypothetical protein
MAAQYCLASIARDRAGRACRPARPVPGRRRCEGGRGLRQGRVGVEAAQDEPGILGGCQALRQLGVAEHLGQAAQHRDVLVALGGDGDHQPRPVIAVPAHAVRHLQHGNGGGRDQAAVAALPVWDGDAVAEEGIGLLLAPEHAVRIGRRDGAGIGQELRGLADRRLLVGRSGAEMDAVGGKDQSSMPCRRVGAPFQRSRQGPVRLRAAIRSGGRRRCPASAHGDACRRPPGRRRVST